jgi:hypothetical protein
MHHHHFYTTLISITFISVEISVFLTVHLPKCGPNLGRNDRNVKPLLFAVEIYAAQFWGIKRNRNVKPLLSDKTWRSILLESDVRVSNLYRNECLEILHFYSQHSLLFTFHQFLSNFVQKAVLKTFLSFFFMSLRAGFLYRMRHNRNNMVHFLHLGHRVRVRWNIVQYADDFHAAHHSAGGNIELYWG